MTWVVQIEAEAPPGLPGLAQPGTLIRYFSRMLAAHHGAAAGQERHWSARVVIPRDEPVSPVHTAEQAAFAGKKLVVNAARTVGLPDWPVVRAEAVPDLLGAQEAATVLGVSRQRLHELRRSGQFPVPLAELGNGPVWSGPAIRHFLARWMRLPGPRPAGTAAYQAGDGTIHPLTATADERTGTVWVPVWLAMAEPQLQWIAGLGLASSPRDGTSGPAIFRVPRWEWAQRITEAGTARAGLVP
jgi:hypothetical protein